jgi:hypothetical protein
MPDYGGSMAWFIEDTAQLLLLDDPQYATETLLRRFIQLGIDNYGTTRSNANLWMADGGHNLGRKLPIIFAGVLLQDEEMMHVKAEFQEDQQTYYGKGYRGQKALFSLAPWCVTPNHEEIDPQEWVTHWLKPGEKEDPGNNNDGVKAEAYRWGCSMQFVPFALVARLTGAVEFWDHPAFFDYADRYIAEESMTFEGHAKIPDSGKTRKFSRAMWDEYRATADQIGAEVKAKAKTP